MGRHAARQLLSRYTGRWEIAFQEENPGAARFWRRLAVEVCPTGHREERRAVPGKPHLPPDTWLLLNEAQVDGTPQGVGTARRPGGSEAGERDKA